MLVVEPELVLVEPEPEVEEEVPDLLLDEDEVVVEALEAEEEEDLRLAELTVPLVPELLPAEPVGLRIGVADVTGVTKVEFWPAGTTAGADCAVATAGWVVAAAGWVVIGAGWPVTTPRELVKRAYEIPWLGRVSMRR